jgi:death-on-curing protein
MKIISLETMISLHSELIAKSGGTDGVRDSHLLDQSVNSPFHTFGGQYLYPNIEAMAAHLAFSLIKNHPFIDDNKRIGILAMMVFLDINGHPVICADDELIALGWGLADDSVTESELLNWIFARC